MPRVLLDCELKHELKPYLYCLIRETVLQTTFLKEQFFGGELENFIQLKTLF